MTDNTVLVNGIRADTGRSDVGPMTAKDLYDRVRSTAGAASKPPAGLVTGGQADIARKLAAIAKFLVQSLVHPPGPDEAEQGRWCSELAERLVTELRLPGVDKPETRQAAIEAVARRLKRDTLYKLENILDFLAQGNADRLAAFLLVDADEAQDDRQSLKGRLKRSALASLGAIKDEMLTPARAAELEADPASRRGWLNALVAALRQLPVAALNAATPKSPAIANFSPLRLLTDALGALPHGPAAPSPWLDPLFQQLAVRLDGKGWDDSRWWNLLIDLLRDALGGRIAEGQPTIAWADLLDGLDKWLGDVQQKLAHLGVVPGFDPAKLDEVGWGIIFPWEAAGRHRFADIETRLAPLLKRRQGQAGTRFRVYRGGDGYRPNDTARTWMARAPRAVDLSQPVDPSREVPYYLLLVGSPEEIPFPFQYQLDVQYAVGRIDFGDDLESYGRYAANVVDYEQAGGTLPAGRVTFFSTEHAGDPMTRSMSTGLVAPLWAWAMDRNAPGPAWQVVRVEPEDAGRERLRSLLGGGDKPDLLFAACHGVEFAADDPRQMAEQGALLCQDWKGPLPGAGAVPRECYLAGEDLAPGDDLGGLIAFFFSCFGAGTPRVDEYYRKEFKDSGKVIAPQAFTAGLPKAMLGRGKGALAVVGHVERAWAVSFMDAADNPQVAVFQSALDLLLDGKPLGLAMEYFNERYAAVSTELSSLLEVGFEADPYTVAELWTANNDARGFVVLGDPAVRLRR